jgi:hypothetical protein
MTSGAESERLSEAYSIASPAGRPFQTAFDNLNRRSPNAMDTQNPDRGPLLFISRQIYDVIVCDFALGWLTKRGISATAPSESRFR